jgi:DedD protein
MTQQSKERLLGGLLLLAIAAIFLPMLLDGDGVRQGRLQAVLPPAPIIASIEHYQPQYQPHLDSEELADPLPPPALTLNPPPLPLVPTEDAPASEDSAAVEPPTVSRIGAESPVLDQQGVPAGWTLQLASFKERGNAEALQLNLHKRGYQAYIRDKGDISKVFVGPDLQKSVVDSLKDELKKEFKLDGLVLRFRP